MDHGQVGFEVLFGEVGIVGDHLGRSEHPFVDECLGRERADVEQGGLFEARIVAQHVAGLLANRIELALEFLGGDPLGSLDEDLFGPGLGRAGRRTDVGKIRLLGNVAPTDEGLALGADESVEDATAFVAFCGDFWKEDITGGPKTLGG